jgi:hypothetical protein
VTAQGHPRSIFKRPIERGNVVVAEATAREPRVTCWLICRGDSSTHRVVSPASRRLPRDGVVDLQDLRRARIDPNLGEDWH